MGLQIGSRGDAVRSLQTDLNLIYQFDRPQLTLDGIFGMKTKEWVCKYQRANGLTSDGIVGPKTLASISSKRPPGAAPPPPGLSPPATGGARFQNEMRLVFEQQGASSEWPLFWKGFEEGSIPALKMFLGVIGRAEDARAVATFFINLKRWGLTAYEIGLVFEKIKNFQTPDQATKFFDAVTAPTSKAGQAMKLVGEGAAKAGLALLIVECALNAYRGEYSVIIAEIYKYFMGKAVPWAAVIEGIGSMLDIIVPQNTRENNIYYKVLRAVDPVGLGGAAIDSVAALAISLFQMAYNGQVNSDIVAPRLTQLVGRLKQGPTSIFAELGSNSGEALFKISEMTESDFQEMKAYSWAELKEFFS